MSNKVVEQVVDVNDVSRISSGTVVKGDITSNKDIRIDGTVEGKVSSDSKVVVGEKANIKGTIICNVLDIWGKSEGDIFVKDILTIKSSSNIEGSINSKKLQVEIGAQLNGQCRMITDEEFEKISGKKPQAKKE